MEVDDVELEYVIQHPRTPRGCTAENLIVMSTPDNNNYSQHNNQHQHPSSSLKASSATSTMSSFSSRISSTERVNPFEKQFLRNLECTMWSPSVFDNVDIRTPPHQHTWDVDQLAKLFPKNIEESPSSHTNPYPTNSSDEAKAQAAIDRFFSNGPIAPSPLEVIPRAKRAFFPVDTPVDQAKAVFHSKSNITYTTESWTNTELCLPPELPSELFEMLQPYFQTDVISETSTVETRVEVSKKKIQTHNTSFNSVRRRLELSFGEIDSSVSPSSKRAISVIPYGDPFADNHKIKSPGAFSDDDDSEEIKFEICD